MRRQAKEDTVRQIYGPGVCYQDLSWDERRRLMDHVGSSGKAAGSDNAKSHHHHLRGKADEEPATSSSVGVGGGSPSKAFRRHIVPPSHFSTTHAAPARQVRVPQTRFKQPHLYGHPLKGRGDDSAQVPHHIRYGAHRSAGRTAVATAALTTDKTVEEVPTKCPKEDVHVTMPSAADVIVDSGAATAADVFTPFEGAPETSLQIGGIGSASGTAGGGGSDGSRVQPTGGGTFRSSDSEPSVAEGNLKVLEIMKRMAGACIQDEGAGVQDQGDGGGGGVGEEDRLLAVVEAPVLVEESATAQRQQDTA